MSATNTAEVARDSLTQDALRVALDYDPETGEFTWKWRDDMPNNWNGRFAGAVAGGLSKRGLLVYKVIIISYASHYAHRLAWLYEHGRFPEHQIDHIDGNGLNNRIANLREVSQPVNGKNARLRTSSTTGVSGVTWLKRDRKYRVVINPDGVRVYGGLFLTLEAAAARAAELYAELGYHPNHGLTREQRATTTARPTVYPHQHLLENPFALPSDERHCVNSFECI